MQDDKGNPVTEVFPSFPAEILGLNGVPDPGDKFMVVPDEKSARAIGEQHREEEAKGKIAVPAHFKLEDLYKKIKEEHVKQLKIILKADVGGTLEAVEEALKKIPTQEVELILTHKGVGAINSSDILLAEVTDAIIVGFKVSADSDVRELAKKKGIEVRIYQIVYELLDDVKAALEGLLTPQIKRVFVGRAKVKTVFKLSRAGVIAGCVVEKGKILRNLSCQLMRDNKAVFEGKVQSLKRFKDDVREVAEGVECGIGLGIDDIKEGDYIDVFNEEVISRRLSG
jgi:translation initiation factor IF-2